MFEEFDDTLVASAGLEQLHYDWLEENGQEATVKDQSNEGRDAVGCGLYVLSKAVGAWEGIVEISERSFKEWAEEFYGEFDTA